MGEVKYLGSKSLINTSLNACDSEQCPMLVFNSTQRCQNSSLGWPGEDDLKLGWVRRRLSLGFGLPASIRRVGQLVVESFSTIIITIQLLRLGKSLNKSPRHDKSFEMFSYADLHTSPIRGFTATLELENCLEMKVWQNNRGRSTVAALMAGLALMGVLMIMITFNGKGEWVCSQFLQISQNMIYL